MDERARRELIASTFDEILELDTMDRSAALSRLAPELRAEIETLLSAFERKGARLEPANIPGADVSGLRAGAYRLVRLVGRGGMGAVYEAERADATFVKRVAVKLIREDIAGADVARRFARERAILAGLEHPNIARMLDGGTLADGREYLVMEFVDGVSLTAYCASRRSGLRERLRLFLQVCDAVQFAHQHLVVHGDLKPGNLLVTADGTVKLVDFGVAKVMEDGDALQRDPLTMLGALTPAYASPEQWRGETLSLQTDVYSLGVVLYELLAGTRPFTLDVRTSADVLHLIEAGAPRPSSVVTDAAAVERALSDLKQLGRKLTGELDTISLTAIDSSSQRRYRLSKFLGRHRTGVSVGTALALTVLGGGIAATIQARRAERERAVAQHISNFLKDMLSAPDASWVRAGNADVRVADVLDAAAARVDSGLGTELAAQAMVRRTIGRAYRALSRFNDADRQLNIALALDVRRGAPAFPDLAEDYHELGLSRYLRGDWASAFPHFSAARQRCNGPGTDTSVVCFEAVGDYALALMSRGRTVESESLYVEALRRGRLRFKEHDAALAVIYGNLGVIADGKGELGRAESMYRSALGAWTGGREPSERVAFFHFLASNQLMQGRLAAAESAVVAGAATASHTGQERGLATMLLWLDGAQARRRAGDTAGARERLARARAAVPPNVSARHPLLASITGEAGLAALAAGDLAAATTLFRASATARAASYAAGDPRVARSWGLLGVTLAARGNYGEGEPLVRHAAHALDSVYTAGHPLAREMRGALAELDSSRAGRETPRQAAARVAAYFGPRP